VTHQAAWGHGTVFRVFAARQFPRLQDRVHVLIEREPPVLNGFIDAMAAIVLLIEAA
jgi:hypothetical protein